MPERTEQTRAKPSLDERVREALDALDSAFKNLTSPGGAVADSELADLEMQSALAHAAGVDESHAPPTPEAQDPASIDPEPVAPSAQDEDFEGVLSEDLDAILAAANEVADETDLDTDRPPLAESASDAQPEPESTAPLAQTPAAQTETDSAEPALAEAVEAADPSESPASIEELDDELADLADSIVEGDFEDAAGAAAKPPTVTRVEQSPAPAVDDAAAQTAATESEATPETSDAAFDKSAATQGEPKAPAAARPRRRAFGGSLASLGARVLLGLSKPTAGMSASTRDTIGWLGLYTTFLAVCVWGFVLLFRKPIAPEPTAEPVGISGEVVAAARQE